MKVKLRCVGDRTPPLQRWYPYFKKNLLEAVKYRPGIISLLAQVLGQVLIQYRARVGLAQSSGSPWACQEVPARMKSQIEIRTYISEKESNIVRSISSPHTLLFLSYTRNVMTKQLQELQCLQVLLQHDIGKSALVVLLISSLSCRVFPNPRTEMSVRCEGP